ncbi:hypothetical protein Acsp04_44070 [Actinomadura sp. NBRC 104425]|uniref:hypothetical protein n=1 Tax=Actinomadura sp. NBRC 104425 TaxID=3032204 RepID=UPI0024A31C04|nr:hypothetical protein [Actinomadura sp. NBRC 104425]GLZ14172.1 hypothetical protein Acsp04_44070 [Actinomadura sp. NBRC 104425]
MIGIPKSDRTRAGYIAGLRMLADLLESNPDIPHDRSGFIGFPLDFPEAEAFEIIDQAAAELTAEGIPFDYNANDHSHSIYLVLAGVRYGFSRVRDSAWAKYEAARSYTENVQV